MTVGPRHARDGDASAVLAASHTGAIVALAFSPDGRALWSADAEGAVVRADVETRRVLGRVRLPLDRARALWVAPDGDAVVDTERGMRVRVRPTE